MTTVTKKKRVVRKKRAVKKVDTAVSAAKAVDIISAAVASPKRVTRKKRAVRKNATAAATTKRVVRRRRRTVRTNDGGNGTYYDVKIEQPLLAKKPYVATCADIIQQLGMTHAEGEAFAAIWRNAAARQGNSKTGVDADYNAKKVSFYGKQMEAAAKRS